MTARLRESTVISGVGQSAVGRRLGRSGIDLTVDAVLAAVTDAGLALSDIDGISTYPGVVAGLPGFSTVGVTDLQEALRLPQLRWYSGGLETPGQLGCVVNALAAVSAGLARHVVCFRTSTEGSAQADRGRASVGLGNRQARAGVVAGFDSSWYLPAGAASPANLVGMYATRHFEQYGTTREQLAQIPLTCRANAGRNERAIYRDPLTLDEYLAAPMISTPLGLYDCDVPCDGSTAVIVSAVDTSADLRRPPVRIEGVGTAIAGRASWDQWDDLTTMAMRDAGAMLWSTTDLAPADVDVALLYDGFSFLALLWLEALGFCKPGEGGPFLEGGERIGTCGELPVNPHGGQLSAGRLHGFGNLYEACRQLWGEAGDHQLARQPEVAVAAAGGGPLAGCLLLRRT